MCKQWPCLQQNSYAMKKKKKDEVEWFASWILETTAEH